MAIELWRAACFNACRNDWDGQLLDRIISQSKVFLEDFKTQFAAHIGRDSGDSPAIRRLNPDFVQNQIDILNYANEGLLGNAFDTIVLRAQDADDNYIGSLVFSMRADDSCYRFFVRDNDQGLKPEIEQAIFNARFPRLKKDYRLSGGAGIHLLATQKIVKQLGGDCGFKNLGVNQGAEFWYNVSVGALSRGIVLFSDIVNPSGTTYDPVPVFSRPKT